MITASSTSIVITNDGGTINQNNKVQNFTFMELNKIIQLPSHPFDVSGLGRNHRIIYIPWLKRIVIKSSSKTAMLDNEVKYAGEAEILTASQAPRRYPQVFTNSSKTQFSGDIRTIMLRVPSDMYRFCCKQGNITAYLRSLIEKEMKKL